MGRDTYSAEVSSVIAFARTETAFLDNKDLVENLAASDFSFDELLTANATVYLVLPAAKLQSYARWLRLMVTVGLRAVARRGSRSPLGLPALFVRKTAKEYGTRRLAEGGGPAGRVVTLVEDVITTGGAVANAAHALRALGATVTTVVCAIDRSPSGAGELGPEGVMVRSVLTKALLDFARKGLQCCGG